MSTDGPARRGLVLVALVALAALVLGVGVLVVRTAYDARERSVPAAEPTPQVPPDLRLVARFELDEAPGATVLVDRVGGLRGRIGADVVTDGRRHTHPWVEPHSGVFPEHTSVVPAGRRLHRLLNPGRGSFSVTIRYRTRHRFGNIAQKGQGEARGGYWKLENPERAPRCMFRGADGRTRTGYLEGFEAGARLSPGWHTLTCVRTPEWVQMWVDGQPQPRAYGPTGVIRNREPLSFAGKSSCDAVRVTCDYFSGRIAWIEFRRD
ncbi:hypothetical protein [Nocardioides campestrisoli]|uniref:hypothetical protein n=1 Tax=Nocardioides campestrisoli TaxID=2736757 RepID=UPI00163D8ADF|nr:hypothetical protein [Nocardioides campestrisoli]